MAAATSSQPRRRTATGVGLIEEKIRSRWNVQIEPFVDAAKAAEFLNLRPRRLLQLARQGFIPAYPIGDGQRRVWRFRLSELASALAARAIKCGDAAVRTGKGKH